MHIFCENINLAHLISRIEHVEHEKFRASSASSNARPKYFEHRAARARVKRLSSGNFSSTGIPELITIRGYSKMNVQKSFHAKIEDLLIAKSIPNERYSEKEGKMYS